MQRQPVPTGSLFGLRGGELRAAGIVLTVIGIVLLIGPFIGLLLWFGSQARVPDPGAGFGAMALAAVVMVVGTMLLGLGGMALRLGLVRPVASYVAAEASPAIQTVSEAWGRGMPAAPPAVRVRCRNCGYLDSEDATFCSKCGQPL